MGYYFKHGFRSVCKKRNWDNKRNVYVIATHMTFSRIAGFVFCKVRDELYRDETIFNESVISFADAASVLGTTEAHLKKILLRGSSFKSGCQEPEIWWRTRNYYTALGIGCIPRIDFENLLRKVVDELNTGIVESERRELRLKESIAAIKEEEGTAKHAAAQLRALGIMA
jgi:hypothetical protein